jgi:hypothetical protein
MQRKPQTQMVTINMFSQLHRSVFMTIINPQRNGHNLDVTQGCGAVEVRMKKS